MPTSLADSAQFAGSACSELIDPLSRSASEVEPTAGGPILVATDGSSASAAAIRTTAALAARTGRRIEAVLIEGTLSSLPGVCIGARALRQEHIPPTTQLGRVREQLCTILVGDSWRLRVEFGRVAPSIARAARSTRASLIVMGSKSHGPARRWAGGDTIARVLQSTQIPVLAVAATARALPQAAVAAIDFSPASLRAAREARDLLARPGMLHLVHVRRTNDAMAGEMVGWDAVYAAGIATKLEQLATELTVDGVTVIPRSESGTLIETLLRVSAGTDAELIACGADGRNAIERLVLGKVPLESMYRAGCSMLIAPNASSLVASEESR
jgi:nucleotide-binding universal stress UspA family protein